MESNSNNPRWRILIVTLPFIILFSGCSHRVSKLYPEIIPKSFEATLVLNPQSTQALNILYLGCGNLVLEKEGDAIITDPFFSNQKVLKLVGSINTNPDRYSEWKETLESHLSPSSIKAGLVAHTHYDHVMDLPILLHEHFFPKMEAVYGNPYLPQMLQHFKNEGPKLVGLQEQQIYNPNEPNDSGYEWIKISPKIRFLAIESNHAPHVGHKLFMSKSLKEKHFQKHLVWPEDKVSAFKWTVGTTYSFLVDFISSDTLRVFIQTSASEPPNGLPPRAELQKKKVDLAILCYASAPNVKDYPGLILDYIKPKKTVLVHWEDFFRTPRSPEDVKLVRGTNPKKVKKRIEVLNLKSVKDHFVMPKPGTFIHVKY